MFSVQIAVFKVSEICSRSGKSQGIVFISICGNPDNILQLLTMLWMIFAFIYEI